ncbi:hypothetical protein VC83_09675 [Pseudogymnoascus destructans]|uniref:HAT C-terminal dimerisation domain-containing protein n=1 Tax=Pseudogymnoascus destructans TaxID=655981 RepID=A0A2P6FGP4_9PEZI|nr:uncharacterized protein VC83_09675 [Pseudogymnoascus destructans]PQM43548.1 hypothetical protein VC83_09675 [Pseudogymnoascus destructans]
MYSLSGGSYHDGMNNTQIILQNSLRRLHGIQRTGVLNTGEVITKEQTGFLENHVSFVLIVEIMLDSIADNEHFIGGKVQHIPCLAHVIQLALSALLGRIRITPTNQEILMNWEEENQMEGLAKLQKDKGIGFTLGKLRKLTIFVNSSHTRRNRFMTLQKANMNRGQPSQRLLRLIQDVSTRWDSTCHMLLRAQQLKSTINQYTRGDHGAHMFRLGEVEWKHIEYIIDLTRPFNFFTTNIGSSAGPTVCYTLRVYQKLLSTLEGTWHRLRHKTYPWVAKMTLAIDAAEKKIKKYYNKLYTNTGSISHLLVS